MLNKIRMKKSSESGFTLVEAMVSIVIIGAVVASQASLLVLGTKAQTRLSTQRLASGILQSEIDNFQTSPWDDIMMQPVLVGGAPLELCQLGGKTLRSSAQIVKPQSVRREDGTAFAITRNVVWTSSGQQVTCTNLPNDRADTKTLTITITWTSEGVEKTRTGSIILSRSRVNAEQITGVG